MRLKTSRSKATGERVTSKDGHALQVIRKFQKLHKIAHFQEHWAMAHKTPPLDNTQSRRPEPSYATINMTEMFHTQTPEKLRPQSGNLTKITRPQFGRGVRWYFGR